MPKKLILRELSRYKIGTYADVIYRQALLRPEQEAFIYGTERVTFAEFNNRVNSLIHALWSMRVKKGDVLGVLSWNCLEYIDVYGAALKGGFIISPFNARLKANELDYLINYSEANTLFVGPELLELANSLRSHLPKVEHYISFEGFAHDMICHRDLLTTYSKEEPDIQVEEDDPIFIIYTSGTTGVPRGALYTHRCSMEETRNKALDKALEPGDTYVLIMPLFHIVTSEMLIFFFVGGKSIIVKFFDPAAILRIIQEEKATDTFIVPTHLASILALPDLQEYDFSSLKRITYGGSPMPLELLKKGMKYCGPIFFQAYGQTESGPSITHLRKESHQIAMDFPEEQQVLTSCGQPCISTHLRIIDDKGNDVEPGEIGEITVQSRHNMVEFWHKPKDTQATIVDGWLYTGDMGYYDENGFIYIVDRKRDMIISGGENIYSREVEEVISRHPSVQEVAVIGIPDPYWVERVHAVVTVKQGINLTADEVVTFCKQRLAGYKAPKSAEIIDSLPKNPTGKILKKELRAKYWEGVKRN
jgi:long-chain acyl-CoA synthetase